MGWFGKTKTIDTSAQMDAAKDEKESAAKKARLVETEGGSKGSELNASQGKSVRKVFGA